LHELVQHGKNGLVFDNEQQLAEQMIVSCSLCSLPSLRGYSCQCNQSAVLMYDIRPCWASSLPAHPSWTRSELKQASSRPYGGRTRGAAMLCPYLLREPLTAAALLVTCASVDC